MITLRNPLSLLDFDLGPDSRFRAWGFGFGV